MTRHESLWIGVALVALATGAASRTALAGQVAPAPAPAPATSWIGRVVPP
jgi:hypothetical protein